MNSPMKERFFPAFDLSSTNQRCVDEQDDDWHIYAHEVEVFTG